MTVLRRIKALERVIYITNVKIGIYRKLIIKKGIKLQ